MNVVYDKRYKEIIINIIFILFGLSIITFFKGFFPQILGKLFLFFGLSLFILKIFLDKKFFFIKQFLFYSIFFYLFLYIANYDLGEIPNKDFFKKSSQILFCILIFCYFFLYENDKININLITYLVLGIGSFVIFILFLKNNLNLDILHWVKLFFSEKIYTYNDDVIKKSLLDNYFFRNNPYCVLLNTLILFYLVQNKFSFKECSILFLLILFIFLSTNMFSKVVTLLILSFYLINKNKFGIKFLKFFLILIIFLIATFLILELQIIIDLVNFIFDKIFRFYFDLKPDYIASHIVIYDDKNNINIKIISLSNFEFFSNYSNDLKFNIIRKFYYDYYLGGIFRLLIIKFKLLSLHEENFSQILNSSFYIRLFGGSNLIVENIFTPDVVEKYFIVLEKLNNNHYSSICLNQLSLFDDVKCHTLLINKEYPDLDFHFISASNIRQKLTSTHNSFLTTLIVFNKFYFILIINVALIGVYIIFKGNKDIIFTLLSSLLIFFFEDYLFFNRYNVSIIFWLTLALLLKSIVQKRVY